MSLPIEPCTSPMMQSPLSSYNGCRTTDAEHLDCTIWPWNIGGICYLQFGPFHIEEGSGYDCKEPYKDDLQKKACKLSSLLLLAIFMYCPAVVYDCLITLLFIAGVLPTMNTMLDHFIVQHQWGEKSESRDRKGAFLRTVFNFLPVLFQLLVSVYCHKKKEINNCQTEGTQHFHCIRVSKCCVIEDQERLNHENMLVVRLWY